MNQQSTTTKKIIKPMALAIMEIIFHAVVVEVLYHLLPLFGIKPKALCANWLLLALSLSLISILSFLILYIYKFRVVNEALLEINPRFYEEREYGKWFDYYSKQTEKH